MNSIYIGHAFCHLMAQIRCCNEAEIRDDMLTECIWCVCRLLMYNGVVNEEELDSIRTYLIYHKICEIANNRWYSVLNLLFELCRVLNITEEQGIAALQCAINEAVSDGTEVLADNIYRLYLNNTKE